jgi:hypothetical protein
MQLAIDCVGEIAECMSAVAHEAGVEALVAPVLRSHGDLVLVTLLYFDTRENQIKGVTRQLSGRSVAQAMLDAVPDMVREAFSLPPEPEVPPAQVPKSETAPAPSKPSRAARIVPWTLLGVSVASLAVGIGMGVASERAEDAYGKGAASTKEQIDATYAKQQDAENKALVANICFGVAGASAVAGLATWLLMRSPRKETDAAEEHPHAREPRRVALVPQISRAQVGISLQGMLGR